MQIVNLHLNHYNFFCPATGEFILLENEPINEEAQSLMGYWQSDVISEPCIMNSDFQDAWDAYIQDGDGDEEDEDKESPGWEEVEAFLEKYKNPNWVVFCITNRGMACGPVSSTAWLVIDMDVQSIKAD